MLKNSNANSLFNFNRFNEENRKNKIPIRKFPKLIQDGVISNWNFVPEER